MLLFPTESVDSGTLQSLFFYTAALGLLLLVGIIIRMKVKFLKKLVIPASLTAGIIGLLLGPHVLGFIPVEVMDTWAGYAGILIAVVFAPMLMGVTLNLKKIKETQAIPQLVYSWKTSLIQWGVPLILTALVLMPLFDIPPLFGTVFEVSWHGGHGTAAGMIDVFEELNFPEGNSLALTLATVSLLLGVISGVIIINYGVLKGYTNYIGKDGEVHQEDNPDIIPKKEQQTSSVGTIRGDVVESYAFHIALIAVAVFIGWVLQGFVGNFIPGIPLFPLTMLGGFIVGLVIKRTSFYEAIDFGTFQRIQMVALDFLIVAAVASISIPVVADYWAPMLIMIIIILALMIGQFFYFGPRMFGKDWFEHSILSFGTACGVAAVGFMLLRMVDPKLESDAFVAFGLRAPLTAPFIGGGLLTVLTPSFVVAFGALTVGVANIALIVVILIIAKKVGMFGVHHSNTYFNPVSSYNDKDKEFIN